MTEKRYDYSELKDGTYGIFKDKYYNDNDISFSMRLCEVTNEEQARTVVGQLNGLVEENEQLKQSNERIIKDIDLALGFIKYKGYSLQDIKDYEDAKKEYEEDLANYRKGDVDD